MTNKLTQKLCCCFRRQNICLKYWSWGFFQQLYVLNFRFQRLDCEELWLRWPPCAFRWECWSATPWVPCSTGRWWQSCAPSFHWRPWPWPCSTCPRRLHGFWRKNARRRPSWLWSASEIRNAPRLQSKGSWISWAAFWTRRLTGTSGPSWGRPRPSNRSPWSRFTSSLTSSQVSWLQDYILVD